MLLFGGAFYVQAANYLKITNTALFGGASTDTVLNFHYSVTGPTPFGSDITISYDPQLVPTIASIPTEVTAGSYTISRTNPVPSGWILTSITCYYGDANVYTGQETLAVTSSTDLAAGKVTGIQVTGNREVTCHFYYAFVGNPAPHVTSISPTSKNSTEASFTLTVNGQNFSNGSTIYFGNLAVPTTYVSANKLTTQIASGGAPGDYAITVVSPSPGGGTSNSLNFSLLADPATWPTIQSVSPSSVPTGSPDTTITVTGTNFRQGATVKVFSGQAIVTTYVTSTKLTAVVPANLLTQQTSTLITATNPNGGGTSATNQNVSLRIYSAQYPPPLITGHTPNPIPLSANALGRQTIILNGSSFQDGATIQVYANGILQSENYQVHYLSPTQITFNMHPPTASETMPIYEVVVVNPPDPDLSHQRLTTSDRLTLAFAQTSNQQQNPLPTITSITPTSAMPGEAAFTFRVVGTNFTLTSQIYFGPSATTTYYISPAELQAPFIFPDSYQTGNYNVTVVNPSPGGGTSNVKVFTVGAPEPVIPTITSVTPSTIPSGSPATTLTVQGTNFTAQSVVTIDGVARATNFQSTTSLTVSISPGDITTAGTKLIKVTDPNNGTSNKVVLTVASPSAQYGTLTVTKTTTGGDGTFSFSGAAGSFQITTIDGTGSKTIPNLPPGSYTITEASQPDWQQQQTSCSNITITAGQQATCSFSNEKIQDNGDGSSGNGDGGAAGSNSTGNTPPADTGGGINPDWVALGIVPLIIFAVVGLALMPK